MDELNYIKAKIRIDELLKVNTIDSNKELIKLMGEVEEYEGLIVNDY